MYVKCREGERSQSGNQINLRLNMNRLYTKDSITKKNESKKQHFKNASWVQSTGQPRPQSVDGWLFPLKNENVRFLRKVDTLQNVLLPTKSFMVT